MEHNKIKHLRDCIIGADDEGELQIIIHPLDKTRDPHYCKLSIPRIYEDKNGNNGIMLRIVEVETCRISKED